MNLKLIDIKSDDGIIFIQQSKGNKDRMVALPEKLLELLRKYYVEFKPTNFLFEGVKGNQYSERSVQLVLKN
ncbi:MAG: tyrosine-type recombinase/integrase, partial [Algoriella sp.]